MIMMKKSYYEKQIDKSLDKFRRKKLAKRYTREVLETSISVAKVVGIVVGAYAFVFFWWVALCSMFPD